MNKKIFNLKLTEEDFEIIFLYMSFCLEKLKSSEIKILKTEELEFELKKIEKVLITLSIGKLYNGI